ncbi:hypothetical protein BJX66DRAFT_334009 [Aspergillus keveii]|uniref:F-box domain-containing protein n=1 Tax=Aspergillus keveii TaxID=714993 RepID=A0ABR4GI91_9EURO
MFRLRAAKVSSIHLSGASSPNPTPQAHIRSIAHELYLDMITSVPSEVLLEIFRHVVQDDEDYWRRHASQTFRNPGYPAGLRAHLESLEDIALTCRHLYRAVQPLLYRTVWIFSSWQLHRFTQTLASAPSLARHVRGLVVSIGDPEHVTFRRGFFREELARCSWPGRKREFPLASDLGPVNALIRPLEEAVAALMVLEVLVRCKGLRYLHYFSGYTWFDIAFHPLLSKTTPLLNNELGCNFLERIGQVAVTQVCGLVGGSSGYVRLPSVSLLAGLFTSTTFELSPSSRIRSLDLGATLLDSDTITSVLSSFRNLEVLRYDMAHPSIATYALTTDYLSIFKWQSAAIEEPYRNSALLRTPPLILTTLEILYQAFLPNGVLQESLALDLPPHIKHLIVVAWDNRE